MPPTPSPFTPSGIWAHDAEYGPLRVGRVSSRLSTPNPLTPPRICGLDTVINSSNDGNDNNSFSTPVVESDDAFDVSPLTLSSLSPTSSRSSSFSVDDSPSTSVSVARDVHTTGTPLNIHEILRTEPLVAVIARLSHEKMVLEREILYLKSNMMVMLQWTNQAFTYSDKVSVVEALTDLCALQSNPYDWREKVYNEKLNRLAESVGESHLKEDGRLTLEQIHRVLIRVLQTFLSHTDGITILPALSPTTLLSCTKDALKPYIPECLLWVFVHTADNDLLRSFRKVLDEYLETCEYTPRGVQVQLLQSRVSEHRLKNRETGRSAWRLWASRQKFLAAKNGWEWECGSRIIIVPGEIPDMGPPDAAEVRSYWPKV